MIFDGEARRVVQTTVEPAEKGASRFRIQSTPEGSNADWTLHFEGQLRDGAEVTFPEQYESLAAIELRDAALPCRPNQYMRPYANKASSLVITFAFYGLFRRALARPLVRSSCKRKLRVRPKPITFIPCFLMAVCRLSPQRFHPRNRRRTGMRSIYRLASIYFVFSPSRA